jgi:uncharacterized RDD family membrane protein YckC
MKCKRCRAMVPDDAESCPSCGEDLSSLRALLKDFYSDEPVRPEEEDVALREPEVFPVKEEKPPQVPTEEVHGDIRIVTGPYPEYDQKLPPHDALSEEIVETEAAKPPAMERIPWGGFWVRSMAMATDSVILMLLMAIFVVLGFLSLSMGVTGDPEIPILRQVLIVLPITLPLGLALMLSYFTFFHGTWGQTIGKMIFGLRVVRTTGHPLTFSRAFARALGYFVSAIPFFLGFFWVALNSDKRSWHDAFTDTMVIRQH